MRKKILSIVAICITIIASVCIVFAALSFFDKEKISLSEDQTIAMNYFIDNTDLSAEQLAALFSFIEGNSKFDPTAELINDSFGLCQWSGKRYENLERFANQEGTSINNFMLQLRFIVEELSPNSQYYALKDYGKYSIYDWIEADNVKDAVITFRAIYAGILSENSDLLESRVDYANQVYEVIKDKLANIS